MQFWLACWLIACYTLACRQGSRHMRNAETVYLVGTEDFGAYNGMTTVTMRLLRGNEVLEVDDVLYVEADEAALAAAWEEHTDMLALDAIDGVRLLAVTDKEAEELYGRRMGDDEDEDELEIVQVATATGWRLTVEGEGTVEIVGDMRTGTWRTEHASGTYEAFVDWDDRRMMRFVMADGTVADVVRADEDCFMNAWLWGLGRH